MLTSYNKFEQSQTVFSCGEDGKVRAWKTTEKDSTPGADDTSSRRLKGKRQKENLKERFKPY